MHKTNLGADYRRVSAAIAARVEAARAELGLKGEAELGEVDAETEVELP